MLRILLAVKGEREEEKGGKEGGRIRGSAC